MPLRLIPTVARINDYLLLHFQVVFNGMAIPQFNNHLSNERHLCCFQLCLLKTWILWTERDRAVAKALALHMPDLNLTLGITNNPLHRQE